MHYLSLIIFLFLSSSVFAANTLNIELNPKEPVVDEPFKVNFIINSKSGDNPIINFDTTSGLEIISRGNSQVSTRTSFINGEMTHERKVVVSYDIVSSKVGISFIKNIKAIMGGEEFKHRNLSVKTLKAARRSLSVFVKAEVAKDQFYVGESILVKYYLYNKSNISMSGTDVKKFPKLDKFLKRYHQESPRAQRVQIGNEIFERRVIYTAQLFGEKPGKYKIDPISLSVRYSQRRSDPFGGLGFGGLNMGRSRTRTLRSKYIELDVLPLPLEGKPKNFRGLVGKHDFKLTYNKTKYLSNEPIEIQLTVSGEGALELFEAPKILQAKEIEEFETNADLTINKDFSATKTFEYTYLGRESVVIDKRDLNLSYFDPVSKSYKTQRIPIEAFEVVAVSGNRSKEKKDTGLKSNNERSREDGSTINGNKTSLTKSLGFVMKPVFKTMSSFVYYSKHLFFIILLSICLMIIVFIAKIIMKKEKKEMGLIDKIKREGLNYKKMTLVFDQISHGSNLEMKIKNSSLGENAEQYFLKLLKEMSSNFSADTVESSRSKMKNMKLDQKYLKILAKKMSHKE